MVVMVPMRRGSIFLALGAQRADFGLVRSQGEPGLGHALGQLPAHGRVAHLGDGTATRTDD
ncbi:hypothetical protein D556_1274 [Bordetella holmesii 41130]|nr:hypothetical protein D556_1274 [Bordetella holmesii 41130]